MNLFYILLTSIKAKINPILTKVKLWLTPSYIKNRLLVRIRTFFLKIFDVRPSDENDYYTFGGWFVSKKLAFAVTVVICVVGGWLVVSMMPQKGQADTPYKIYRYNSIPLKVASGKVQILGKSGYVAYEGDVEKGQVKGNGTLYDVKGNVVYTGEFDLNAYNGEGISYYGNAVKQYEGTFKDNLYQGNGKLYRENGILEYEGEFNQGFMEGEGQLYNSAQEPIYKGTLKAGRILYQELLGKSPEQIAQRYMGRMVVYEGTDVYVVSLPDIDAAYYAKDGSTSLEQELKADAVYVLERGIALEGEWVTTIPKVRAILGDPIYEGNTILTKQDQISLNLLCDSATDALYGKANLELSEIFDDVIEVKDFDKEYQAYLYVFQKDDIVYTFFCKDKEMTFDYYMLEMK